MNPQDRATQNPGLVLRPVRLEGPAVQLIPLTEKNSDVSVSSSPRPRRQEGAECGASRESAAEETRQRHRRETIGEVRRWGCSVSSGARRRSQPSGDKLCHRKTDCVIRRKLRLSSGGGRFAEPSGGGFVIRIRAVSKNRLCH